MHFLLKSAPAVLNWALPTHTMAGGRDPQLGVALETSVGCALIGAQKRVKLERKSTGNHSFPIIHQQLSFCLRRYKQVCTITLRLLEDDHTSEEWSTSPRYFWNMTHDSTAVLGYYRLEVLRRCSHLKQYIYPPPPHSRAKLTHHKNHPLGISDISRPSK